MIEDQEVELASETFLWSHNESIAVTRAWHWVRRSDFTMAPTSLVPSLNRLFIEGRAKSIANELDDRSKERFFEIIRDMGASEADLREIGLDGFLMAENPDYLVQRVFEELPAATHTPFNCTILRDWLFANRGSASFPRSELVCVGDTPFDGEDFRQFLRQQEFRVVEPGKATGCVVLGRKGWSADDVDAVIDRHVGQSLRIYSQEMLLAALAANDDPFYAGPLVLAAFRAGHPGLEFVSQGWPGWVQTWVTHDRRSATPKLTFDPRVDESPLHIMGYKVGRSGVPRAKRHEILQRAFEGPLPITGTRAYMEEWGAPRSPKRLRKISESIAAHCRNAKRRSGRMEQAITDWEADLRWLKQSFYHGHMRLHWPDTEV